MLSDESVSRIDLLYSVARLNDSTLSLSELHFLLQSEITIDELEQAFELSPTLRSKYELHSGYMFERGREEAVMTAVSAEVGKRAHALRYVSLARTVIRRLSRSGSVIVAISGSTSYESAKTYDDLDLFCVTKNDSAWIFLTKALLLLRVSRISSGVDYSKTCLSCVMDMRYAENTFSQEQGPLFARDAMTAIVLVGSSEYGYLLQKGRWMRDFFPGLYKLRKRSGAGKSVEGAPRSSALRVANLFLFHTIGRYIALKSMLENRRIAKARRRPGGTFAARMGSDHCIYESVRYQRMRDMYRKLAERESSQSPTVG